jgi:hypothetical protein
MKAMLLKNGLYCAGIEVDEAVYYLWELGQSAPGKE